MTETPTPGISEYVLLPHAMQDQSSLVAILSTTRDIATAINLLAPGLSETELDKLRKDFCDGLRKALVGRNSEWVISVEVESDSVVIRVKNPDHIDRKKTMSALLSEVYNQLLPLPILARYEIYVMHDYELVAVVSWRLRQKPHSWDIEVTFPPEFFLPEGLVAPGELASLIRPKIRNVDSGAEVRVFSPRHGYVGLELFVRVSLSATAHAGTYPAIIRTVIQMVEENSATQGRFGIIRIIPQPAPD